MSEAGKTIIVWLITATACIAVGYSAGHEHASRSAADKVSRANIDTALWRSRAEASQNALDVIATKQKQQLRDLDAVRAITKSALDERDSANNRYLQLRDQRKSDLTKTAHEDPDCSDLARPLCPAMARRLFTPAHPDAPTDH